MDLASRGVPSLETRPDSAGLRVPPLSVKRNMCKINAFPQPRSGVARQDRTAERGAQKRTAQGERERSISCCQGHHQSEAVLGLGSNVG